MTPKQKEELKLLGIRKVFSEHTYKQAPYQDIQKEEYEVLLKQMPKKVDWSKLAEYEQSDMTVGAQELACAAGFCEIQ